MRIIVNHKWKQGNLVKQSKFLCIIDFLDNYKSDQILFFRLFRQKKLDNPKFKEEEEALRKRFTEQVKQEESRFRQWEQHVSTLKYSILF
jgi:septin family protein